MDNSNQNSPKITVEKMNGDITAAISNLTIAAGNVASVCMNYSSMLTNNILSMQKECERLKQQLSDLNAKQKKEKSMEADIDKVIEAGKRQVTNKTPKK